MHRVKQEQYEVFFEDIGIFQEIHAILVDLEEIWEPVGVYWGFFRQKIVFGEQEELHKYSANQDTRSHVRERHYKREKFFFSEHLK